MTRPVLAGAAMALSSVSMVSNWLRLRRFRPREAAHLANAKGKERLVNRRRIVSAALLIPVAVLAGMANAAGPALPRSTVAVPGGFYTNVSPAVLTQMLARKDFAFINVHVPYEGQIKGTDADIPYDQVEARIRELPVDRTAPIVLYCRSGTMSATAAETLVRLGYTRVFNLEGGFLAWQQAGYPVTR